ncbi:Cohesin domain-containing protein [Paenibacillus uliginis N3/975]|uniref:Cohesin domain-containing protein n=1 Tax=Paenibacillus uliginis N3/975 TaxID=1313296 RepID=A0A1X7GYJ0_9BACL|nr:S-layer homology domain-containing protein [Paenibacillus uliginis]SMF75935.1 Cohesin domain-containing protein [Paenibacillus uliginis N3/975]
MMKWMRITIPAIMLCLIMAVASPAAADAVTKGGDESVISLKTETSTVSKGDVVKIKVSVHHVTDLYGIQFRVKYDASKLALKEAVAVGGYNDFGGKKTDADKGTVLLPLLREQVSNVSEVPALDIAELSFTAHEAGKATVELLEIKAVSTESFKNEAGLKDLKAITMIVQGPLNISVQGSTNPGVPSNPDTPSSPSTPVNPGGQNTADGDLTKALKEIEQMLNKRQLKEAVSAVSSLFAKEIPSFSVDKRTQWEATFKKLIEDLQRSVTLGTDSSDGSAIINDESLQFAVRSITDLLALSKRLGLQTEGDKLIILPLASNTKSATSLHMTPEQMVLLEKNGMTMVLEWAQGKVKVYPESLPKKSAVRISLSSSSSTVKEYSNELRHLVSYNLAVSTVAGAENVSVTQLPGTMDLVLPFKAADGQLHKLGVYEWDEQTGSWKYMRNAKQTNGLYELGVNKPGTYAIMEYSVDYTDIQKLYNEAKHAVEALTAKHLMFGTGEGKFSPNQEITRAEFTSLLVRAMNLEVSTKAPNVFKDVKPGAWYTGEVYAAWEAGIVKGSGNSFQPNEKLTREQMAVMLMNAIGAAGKEAVSEGHNKFRDDDQISSWAKEAIYSAKEKGFIKGNALNNYSPKEHASRSEAAIILLRWINQL